MGTKVLCSLPPANEVWGKVIFLHLSVILFTGGSTWAGTAQAGTSLRYPPRAGTPPGRYTPQVLPWGLCTCLGGYLPGRCTCPGGVYLPGGYTCLGGVPVQGGTWGGVPAEGGVPARQVHPLGRYIPREQCMLGDTGNKRAVRIPLECILV